MNGKIEKHVVAVGARVDAIESLFRRFAERTLNGTDDAWTMTQLMTAEFRGRTLTRQTDMGRVTLIDHDGLNQHIPGSAFVLDDDERLVELYAEGQRLTALAPTIVEAIGLTPGDDVFSVDELDDSLDKTLPAGTTSISIAEDVKMFIALARWLSLPVKPPLLLAHATSDEEALRAVNAIRSASPPFVRGYTLAYVLNSRQRDFVNGMLSAAQDDLATVTVPSRQLVVLCSEQGEEEVFAAVKMPTAKPDGRRIARVFYQAAEAFPDPSAILSLAVQKRSDAGDTLDVEHLVRERDRLREHLEREQATVATLESRIATLRRELRAAHYELGQATSDDEADDDDTPVEVEEHDAADVDAEPSRVATLAALSPSTFDEVFSLAREHLPAVVLPERVADQVAELAGHGKTARWVRRTWEILLTLQDYAEARADGASVPNVRSYMQGLSHPLFAPNQVAHTESNMLSSNGKFRAERTFPVPAEVDPSGRVFMEAHARVDSGGKYPAPRLYFYDDTTGATKQVHVGYVGPHLTNFRTS